MTLSPSDALQSLLRWYPSGAQLIQEALQNADDTHRASRVVFASLISDHTPLSKSGKTTVIGESDCRGPLVCFMMAGLRSEIGQAFGARTLPKPGEPSGARPMGLPTLQPVSRSPNEPEVQELWSDSDVETFERIEVARALSSLDGRRRKAR